jgi:hypothetical protein
VKRVRAIWDEFDVNHDGKMDLEEINAVIGRLKQDGFNPAPMSQVDLANGSLDFDEFSVWFLAQENLQLFETEQSHRVGLPHASLRGMKRGGKKGAKILHTVAKGTVKGTGSVALGLLKQSGKLCDTTSCRLRPATSCVTYAPA